MWPFRKVILHVNHILKKKRNNTRHVIMCRSILQSLHQFRLEEDEERQK